MPRLCKQARLVRQLGWAIVLDGSDPLFDVPIARRVSPWQLGTAARRPRPGRAVALASLSLRRDTGRAMSQESIELVERAHERLNEGDIDGLIALCDGDFELDMSARLVNPDIYRGHEGIRRFYGEVRDVWEEFRWEPQHFLEADNKVVVLVHSHGRGRGSGLEMARDAAMVWTVRDGRAVSVRFYIEQTKALESVRLPE
jgi:uncharacterized protein